MLLAGIPTARINEWRPEDWPDPQSIGAGGKRSRNLRYVSEPRYNQSKSMAFTAHEGDRRSQIPFSNFPLINRMLPGSRTLLGMSIFLPPPPLFVPQGYVSLWDIHNRGSMYTDQYGPRGGRAPFMLQMRGLELEVVYQQYEPGAQQSTGERFRFGAAPIGSWWTCLVDYYASREPDGWFNFYFNGRLVASKKGIRTYHGEDGGLYFKPGIYLPGGAGPSSSRAIQGTDSLTVYYGSFVSGDRTATPAEIMARLQPRNATNRISAQAIPPAAAVPTTPKIPAAPGAPKIPAAPRASAASAPAQLTPSLWLPGLLLGGFIAMRMAAR